MTQKQADDFLDEAQVALEQAELLLDNRDRTRPLTDIEVAELIACVERATVYVQCSVRVRPARVAPPQRRRGRR